MIRIFLTFLALLSVLSGCASLPENVNRVESHAYTDTQNTLLGKDIQDYRKQGKNGDEQLLWHGYEDGSPVTFDVDPYTSFWRRFGVGFMSLLPIESQL